MTLDQGLLIFRKCQSCTSSSSPHPCGYIGFLFSSRFYTHQTRGFDSSCPVAESVVDASSGVLLEDQYTSTSQTRLC